MKNNKIKRKKKSSLVLDIGGTNVRAALISPRAKIEKYKKEKTAKNISDFKKQVLTMVENLKQSGMKEIGISLAGWIDYSRQKVIKSPNIKFLDNFAFGEFFKKIKMNVYLENDANAAALAEHKFGAGQGFENMIYITISTGIGGGIIIDNKLYKGQGLAGEIGHINILPQGQKCSCGSYGCLETISSGKALEKIIKKAPKNSQLKLFKNQKPSSIFEAAKSGDKYSQKNVFQFLAGLGIAISDLTYLFHPQVIVLGGGLFLAQKMYILPSLKKYVNLRLNKGFKKTVKIFPAKLGEHSSLVGASLIKK